MALFVISGVSASGKSTVARRRPRRWRGERGGQGTVRRRVHGMPEWCVTAALVLAVVRQPVGDLTYTAVRGAGAHRNGRHLRASAKASLDAAIVATGQDDSCRRVGASVTVSRVDGYPWAPGSLDTLAAAPALHHAAAGVLAAVS